MKGIKRFLLFLMVAVCVIAAPVGAYAAKTSGNKSGNIDTDDFAIKVVCGIEGNYKYGAAIPVNIDIESKTEDFTGLVRIIVPGSTWYGSEAMAYEKEILLTANSPKRVTLSAYGGSGATTFTFQLEDEKGKVLIEEPVKIASKVNQNALVGVLSEDYTALNYMDKLAIHLKNYEGETQLVELSENDIPEHFSGIEAISYLVIDRFDTSKLSGEQIGAIADWVSQGGVLIVSGGSDCKQTLSGLMDIVPLKDIKNTEAKFDVYSKDAEADTVEIEFANDGSLNIPQIEGANNLDGVITQSELIRDYEYNNGHIVVTGFGLGMEPVVSWGQNSKFAQKLFEASAKGYSSQRLGYLNYGSYSDVWSMRSALDTVMDDKYPHVTAIIIILACFVLFGPIIYFVLKKLDKRELLWTIIPVCAVAFTVIIFIANADVRIRYPISKSITVLYDEDDEGISSKSASVSMGVLVPGTKHTTVLASEKLVNPKVVTGEEEYYDTQNTKIEWNNDYTSSIRQTADGYLLGYDNTSTFKTKYVSFDYTGETKVGEGLVADCNRTVTGISGKIVNNTEYDFSQVCVFTYGRAVPLGQIKKGQTVEFTEKDNQAFFDMDLYNLKFPSVKRETKNYNELVNVYTMAYQNYMYNDVENNRSSVFLAGYIGEWDGDYIQDENVKEYNKAIYIKKNNIGYSDYEDADIQNLFSYANQSDQWDMNDGQLYSTNAEVMFDLSDDMDKVYALIRARDSERRYGQTKNTKIFAWNNETQEYDELFVDDIVVKFDNGCPYLDDEGRIKMKFTAGKSYEDYVPFITVVGGME